MAPPRPRRWPALLAALAPAVGSRADGPEPYMHALYSIALKTRHLEGSGDLRLWFDGSRARVRLEGALHGGGGGPTERVELVVDPTGIPYFARSGGQHCLRYKAPEAKDFHDFEGRLRKWSEVRSQRSDKDDSDAASHSWQLSKKLPGSPDGFFLDWSVGEKQEVRSVSVRHGQDVVKGVSLQGLAHWRNTAPKDQRALLKPADAGCADGDAPDSATPPPWERSWALHDLLVLVVAFSPAGNELPPELRPTEEAVRLGAARVLGDLVELTLGPTPPQADPKKSLGFDYTSTIFAWGGEAMDPEESAGSAWLNLEQRALRIRDEEAKTSQGLALLDFLAVSAEPGAGRGSLYASANLTAQGKQQCVRIEYPGDNHNLSIAKKLKRLARTNGALSFSRIELLDGVECGLFSAPLARRRVLHVWAVMLGDSSEARSILRTEVWLDKTRNTSAPDVRVLRRNDLLRWHAGEDEVGTMQKLIDRWGCVDEADLQGPALASFGLKDVHSWSRELREALYALKELSAPAVFLEVLGLAGDVNWEVGLPDPPQFDEDFSFPFSAYLGLANADDPGDTETATMVHGLIQAGLGGRAVHLDLATDLRGGASVSVAFDDGRMAVRLDHFEGGDATSARCLTLPRDDLEGSLVASTEAVAIFDGTERVRDAASGLDRDCNKFRFLRCSRLAEEVGEEAQAEEEAAACVEARLWYSPTENVVCMIEAVPSDLSEAVALIPATAVQGISCCALTPTTSQQAADTDPLEEGIPADWDCKPADGEARPWLTLATEGEAAEEGAGPGSSVTAILPRVLDTLVAVGFARQLSSTTLSRVRVRQAPEAVPEGGSASPAGYLKAAYDFSEHRNGALGAGEVWLDLSPGSPRLRLSGRASKVGGGRTFTMVADTTTMTVYAATAGGECLRWPFPGNGSERHPDDVAMRSQQLLERMRQVGELVSEAAGDAAGDRQGSAEETWKTLQLAGPYALDFTLGEGGTVVKSVHLRRDDVIIKTVDLKKRDGILRGTLPEEDFSPPGESCKRVEELDNVLAMSSVNKARLRAPWEKSFAVLDVLLLMAKAQGARPASDAQHVLRGHVVTQLFAMMALADVDALIAGPRPPLLVGMAALGFQYTSTIYTWAGEKMDSPAESTGSVLLNLEDRELRIRDEEKATKLGTVCLEVLVKAREQAEFYSSVELVAEGEQQCVSDEYPELPEPSEADELKDDSEEEMVFAYLEKLHRSDLPGGRDCAVFTAPLARSRALRLWVDLDGDRLSSVMRSEVYLVTSDGETVLRTTDVIRWLPEKDISLVGIEEKFFAGKQCQKRKAEDTEVSRLAQLGLDENAKWSSELKDALYALRYLDPRFIILEVLGLAGDVNFEVTRWPQPPRFGALSEVVFNFSAVLGTSDNMDEDLVDDTETMSTGTFSVDPRRGTVFLAALAPTRYAGGVHGLELLLALSPDTLVVRVKEGPDAAPRCLRLPVSAEALGDSAGASSAQAAGDFQGVEAVGAQTDCNLFQFRPPCDFGACGSVKLWHSSRRQVICGLETLSRGEGAQAAMAAGAHLSLADLATCRDLAGEDGEAPPTPTMPAAWTQDGKCILGPGSQRLLKEDDTAQGSYPDDMRAADCWSACVARGSYGCCRINYDWTPARCHWDPTGMTSTPTTGSAHWASNIQAEPGDNPIGCEVYASNASWCDEPGRDLEGAAADKCCACGGGEPPHDLGAAGAGGALLEDASCLPADGAEAPWLSLDALAVPPPGPGAEPAVAVVSAVVQGADALGLLPAPARAVLSRMILTLPLPKAPTATPATPMEDVVLRIANAGFTGWRPNVAEVKFYSDQLCTKRVTRERLHNSSGWNHAPGQKKYTPDLAIDGSEAAQSHWRPQCSSCQPDEAWIEFAFKPSTVIQCIEANNLGKGSGGGKHWDGGIRVYNVTDQIYRDGARQVVVGYAEGNTFILEEERGPTTATLTTSVVEAPAVDIFSEDLKAFSFLYASEYTERSPKRDGATPNRPHLGPRADSVGTVQVDVEGRQLRLQGAGQASQGVPSVTSEVIVKVSDGKVQFWARTCLPAPDTWERCWHAETDLPSSFVDDRPVNPFSRSVPVLGMKPAKEPGDRFELNLSPTEQVRFSVENRSRLRSILLEDRGGGSGGGGGHDVVVTVTKWATAPLGKGTFDPASLGCADLHVPGREVNRWLERWALLRVFLPGPPSGGKDPDPARLLQGASGAKELPELYAV